MCQIESKATKLYMIYIPCLQEEHLVRQLKYHMASSFSSWRVIDSVHSPFWRVFEKNGFPHCDVMQKLVRN
jgi:hypothetical protein